MAKKPAPKPTAKPDGETAMAKKPSLVRMVRDESHPAPHTADVHPDEVENFRAGGWEEA